MAEDSSGSDGGGGGGGVQDEQRTGVTPQQETESLMAKRLRDTADLRRELSHEPDDDDNDDDDSFLQGGRGEGDGDDEDDDEEYDGDGGAAAAEMLAMWDEFESAGRKVKDGFVRTLGCSQLEAEALADGEGIMIYLALDDAVLETRPVVIDPHDAALVVLRQSLADREAELEATKMSLASDPPDEDYTTTTCSGGGKGKGRAGAGRGGGGGGGGGGQEEGAAVADAVLVDRRAACDAAAKALAERERELERADTRAARVEKDVRVVQDVRAVRSLGRTNVRAHLLAAKDFAFYVKAKMESLGTFSSVRRLWDKPCSPPEVLLICGATGDWLQEQGLCWMLSFRAALRLMEAAGYTNGGVVCMRGFTVDMIEAEGGQLSIPLAPPGTPNLPARVRTLAFPLVDDMLTAAAEAAAASPPAAAAPAPAARTAAGGVSSRQTDSAMDMTPVHVGSSARAPRSRLVFSPVDQRVESQVEGVVGAMGRNQFALGGDTVNKNHKSGLYFRSLSQAIASHLRMPGNEEAVVSIMIDDRGGLQNLRQYAERMVPAGSGDIFVDEMKKVAATCPLGTPEDNARDTSKDVCIFPPCPMMISLVANVLLGSKLTSSMLTHDDVTGKLRDLGVCERFITNASDPGLSAIAILNCLGETLLLARKTFGQRLYVPGATKMFFAEYVGRKNTAEGRVSLTRKMVMESPRAKNNSTSARLRLGFEEISRTAEASWVREEPRVRSAAAMMTWFAMSSSCAGTVTGMLVKDVAFEMLEVRTQVPVDGSEDETLDRNALVTNVDIYTSKFGTVSAEGRREGATVVDRQDRTDRIKKEYTDVSSLVLPPHVQLGVQLLRSLESRRLLQLTAAKCLRQGRFALAHRVFQRGVDCTCSVQPAPELDDWAREWRNLPEEEDGSRVVCTLCHEVDIAGVHHPDAV